MLRINDIKERWNKYIYGVNGFTITYDAKGNVENTYYEEFKRNHLYTMDCPSLTSIGYSVDGFGNSRNILDAEAMTRLECSIFPEIEKENRLVKIVGSKYSVVLHYEKKGRE